MNTFITILVFIIILFLYFHLVAQFKKSEDLEIYEMDFLNNEHLQEICEIKQPVLFEFKQITPDFFDSSIISSVNPSTNIKIKDVKDIHTGENITLPFQSADRLMNTDSKSRFYSENNDELIEDISSTKLSSLNKYFQPTFTVNTKYDVMFGSKNAYTPMRYHTNYRQFICVNSGKIHVKMTPWKSRKYLHPENDYYFYEFRSPIDVWNPQPKYLNEMDKIKFLEFDVNNGYVLYIPPYWFYSIKYSNEPDNAIVGITYNSAMNFVANVPNYTMYLLEQQNTKKKVVKVLNLEQMSDNSTPEVSLNETTVSSETADKSQSTENMVNTNI